MNLNLSEKLKTGLTPQEKIDCYEKAIKRINAHDLGICIELCRYFNQSLYKEHIEFLFPEFIEKKPTEKMYDDYWFKSAEERIQVLNKLIEEQKKLL